MTGHDGKSAREVRISGLFQKSEVDTSPLSAFNVVKVQSCHRIHYLSVWRQGLFGFLRVPSARVIHIISSLPLEMVSSACSSVSRVDQQGRHEAVFILPWCAASCIEGLLG